MSMTNRLWEWWRLRAARKHWPAAQERWREARAQDAASRDMEQLEEEDERRE